MKDELMQVMKVLVLCWVAFLTGCAAGQSTVVMPRCVATDAVRADLVCRYTAKGQNGFPDLARCETRDHSVIIVPVPKAQSPRGAGLWL